MSAPLFHVVAREVLQAPRPIVGGGGRDAVAGGGSARPSICWGASGGHNPVAPAFHDIRCAVCGTPKLLVLFAKEAIVSSGEGGNGAPTLRCLSFRGGSGVHVSLAPDPAVTTSSPLSSALSSTTSRPRCHPHCRRPRHSLRRRRRYRLWRHPLCPRSPSRSGASEHQIGRPYTTRCR